MSGVERGVRNPTVLVLGRLADTLGVSAMELVRLVDAGVKKRKKRSAIARSGALAAEPDRTNFSSRSRRQSG